MVDAFIGASSVIYDQLYTRAFVKLTKALLVELAGRLIPYCQEDLSRQKWEAPNARCISPDSRT